MGRIPELLHRNEDNMGYSKGKIKQICGLMLFAALLILTVIYSEVVLNGVAFTFDIASPFIVGGIIAFVLNIPMKLFEEKLFAKWKGKLAKAAKRPVSMLMAIIFVVLIITIVVLTVVPQISSTVTVLGKKIPAFLEDVADMLAALSKKYPQLEEQVLALQALRINWDSVVDSAFGFLKNGVGNVLTSTVTVAGSIIGGVVDGVISFIFALYILSQKEVLADQGKRIVSAYCSNKMERSILKVLGMLHKNFSSFITGQCMEAVILGAMFVVAMSVFRMPYAFMVGVLIAFTALIPVVGAFVGCAVGAFLILIENPVQALWFVVMFLIIQQIEGNLIYPKVVGNSVGLPSIWVLMAVSLGGSLFGVAGMLFFIPLLATFYALLRENVNERNYKKKETCRSDAEEPVQNSVAASKILTGNEEVNEPVAEVMTESEDKEDKEDKEE